MMTPKEALDNIAIISEILVDVSKSHIMCPEAIKQIRKLDIPEIYFTLRPALTELEELKQEVIARQETEDSLTKWVNELTDGLEELKRYPTAEEVCEALSEHIGSEVRFLQGRGFCYIHGGATSHYLDSGVRTVTLELLLKKPHLITLIGRFYERLEKVGKELK